MIFVPMIWDQQSNNQDKRLLVSTDTSIRFWDDFLEGLWGEFSDADQNTRYFQQHDLDSGDSFLMLKPYLLML